MTTSTAELPATDSATVDHTTEPQSELWTSDSEREAARQDDATLGSHATTDHADVGDSGSPEGTTGVTGDGGTSASPAEEDVFREGDQSGARKPKGKPRNDPQARVEAATRKEAAAKEEARQARDEAARLRAELDRLRAPATSAEPPAADTDRFWADPLTVARQLAAEEAAKVYAAQQQQHTQAQMHQAYRQRVDAFAATHPDFHEVINQAPEVPGVILHAILASERGAELAYDLGSHPEIAAQLAEEFKSLPADAVPLVRRVLEARLSATAVASSEAASLMRPSAAKPPIPRVGGTASFTPADPEDLAFGPEYIRRENAREKKAREAGRW